MSTKFEGRTIVTVIKGIELQALEDCRESSGEAACAFRRIECRQGLESRS